jgi:hypothetical protein
MKVWKLIAATTYLGSGVEASGYKEVDVSDSVEIGKNYYDKIGNTQVNYVYLDDIRKVDEVYLGMFRKLKEKYGRAKMPDHAFDFYEETYERAVKDYPYI